MDIKPDSDHNLYTLQEIRLIATPETTSTKGVVDHLPPTHAMLRRGKDVHEQDVTEILNLNLMRSLSPTCGRVHVVEMLTNNYCLIFLRPHPATRREKVNIVLSIQTLFATCDRLHVGKSLNNNYY